MNWAKLVDHLSQKFSQGEELDLSGILFLIGIQETGKVKERFKKDQKIDLMHVAICRVLEPYGFYSFLGYDEEGWPHYELVENLPSLKAGEQSILMKKAILQYFEDQGLE
jgi:hypothetical protein